MMKFFETLEETIGVGTFNIKRRSNYRQKNGLLQRKES
jgi:hypothetical protein